MEVVLDGRWVKRGDFVTGKDGLVPASVENNAGISKTFRIIYRNEEITLDDIIVFRAHVLVDSNKVMVFHRLLYDMLEARLWRLQCFSTRFLVYHL